MGDPPDSSATRRGSSRSKENEVEGRPFRSRMHPRLARRRAAVGREAGHRRLVVLLGALSVLTIAVIAYAALHSSLFSARHVSIVGNQATTDQQILEASGMLAHPALLNIDVARDEAAIEQLPWISKAVLHPEWPDSVLITVTERNPVGKFSDGVRLLGVVDETGRLLEVTSSPPRGLVPLRIPASALAPGQSLPRAEAVLALVASAVPESILHKIKTLEGTSSGVVVVLHSGARAELGQATDLGAKMTALATLLATPSVVLGAHSSIDLRVPDAPVVTSS